MTSVLFLDIDGVLNSDRYRYGLAPGVPADDLLDPAAVEILNCITQRWELQIVVSSSWRAIPGIADLLRDRGVLAEIIGTTPALAAPRGAEIEHWLAAHSEVTAYVILDDDDDMGALHCYLVRTDYRYGLRPEDVERVAAVLEQQPAPR
jgi:hypothetical protein